MDRLTDQRTDGLMDGCTDGPTDGWKDRRMDGWTDRPTYKDARTHLERQSNRSMSKNYVLLLTFHTIYQLSVGRFWTFFNEMITTSNLRNDGENRILLSSVRNEW